MLFWPESQGFDATLTGELAIPAVSTLFTATASLAYDPALEVLSYRINFDNVPASTIDTVTLSVARAAEAGPVLHTLFSNGNPPEAASPITGTVQLTGEEAFWLANGALFLTMTTPEQPTGLVRGQIRSASPVLHLPLYAAPRPAAEMDASPSSLDFGSDATTPQVISMTGQGLEKTALSDVLSLASLMQLQLSSPNRRPAQLSPDDPDLYDHADLKYVGVATNQSSHMTNVAENTIYFGIAMHAPWSTPNEVEIDIFLDVDMDGADDFRVFNANEADYAGGNGVSDAFVSVVEDLRTKVRTIQGPLNVLSPSSYDTHLFFSSAMILAVQARTVGLADGHSHFNYYVRTYSEDLGTTRDDVIDVTPVLSYDLFDRATTISPGN